MNKSALYINIIRPALFASEMQFRQTITDLFVLFTVLVQPLIVATLALWMLREKGADHAIFIMVGSGMTGLWSGLLFMGGNSISWERWRGTLETLASTPTPLQVVVFGKNLAISAQSMLSMIGSYTLASLFFGYALQIDHPLLFAISLVFTAIAFISFGLVMSPLFLMTPAVQSFQNGLEFPVFILSGFLFPIALLPGWTTPVSYALPTYWAARALHTAAGGEPNLNRIFFYWGMLMVFTIIDLIISAYLFKRVLRRVRVDATLGLQ